MRFKFQRKKKTDGVEATEDIGVFEDEAPVFNPPSAEAEEDPGVFNPPKGAAAQVPRYAPVKRDFFELKPEEVETWKASMGTLAARRHIEWRPLLGTLAVVLAAGLIVAAVILFWPSSTVKVPRLVGKALSEAMRSARSSSLEPLVKGFEYSDRYPDGVVVSQKPRAGAVAPKGVDLKLTVSKGPRRWAGATQPEQAVQSPSTGEVSGSTTGAPLSARTVCIDPGGQASASAGSGEWTDPGMTQREFQDFGVRGVSSGNLEHLVNLDIAERLKGLLEKDGVKVVMTRDSGDVDLSDTARAEIASQAGADLLVSIRMGNSNTDADLRGSACLYPARNRWTESFYMSSKESALFVEEALVEACGTEERGVEQRDDKALFNWSKVPVIQALVAYMSNTADDMELSSAEFRQKAAWGLRDGIIKYFQNP